MNLRNTFYLLIPQKHLLDEHLFFQQHQKAFRDGMEKYKMRHCICLHEIWHTIINLHCPIHAYLGSQCTNDKGDPKRYSFDNDMHPEALIYGLIP